MEGVLLYLVIIYVVSIMVLYIYMLVLWRVGQGCGGKPTIGSTCPICDGTTVCAPPPTQLRNYLKYYSKTYLYIAVCTELASLVGRPNTKLLHCDTTSIRFSTFW